MQRVAAIVAWLFVVSACGQSSRSDSPPPPTSSHSQPGNAPGIPSLSTAHGFELAPSFLHVCQQSMTLSPSGSMRWDLYASTEEPRELLAFYRDEMRGVTPQEESGSWIWRIPNAERPDHVMHIYAPGRPGMPTCGTEPPATARALANLSTMTR